jgi:hypothetical protein
MHLGKHLMSFGNFNIPNRKLSLNSISIKQPNFMAKVPAYHSVKQEVHHNNNKCTEGNNIEKENLRSGTGGKPLCKHCSNLS